MLFRYRKELKEIASKYTIKLYSRNGEEDLYIKVSDNCTFVVCMCDNRMDLTIEICGNQYNYNDCNKLTYNEKCRIADLFRTPYDNHVKLKQLSSMLSMIIDERFV